MTTTAQHHPHPTVMVFEVVDEVELLTQMYSSMDDNPLVIYAGAGCSMSAPACSPAWWRLVGDLIEATFLAAPEKHRPAEYSNRDITRQPEEVMESYYFVLGERLLTLFRLLEEGQPNSTHMAVAKLAKVGKVKAIFTTNFDVFFERALKAEGVDYETVVTQAEFEAYQAREACGEAAVAVLKIHGTIDRPDTIVAVANHYKAGKGFSASKATVLAGLLKTCPMLFVGYSGWDFLHQNYQTFWEGVGESGCKGLYWLTLKGMSGGPDLKSILGVHVGSKLRIGAGVLPGFFHPLLERYAPGEGNALLQWDEQFDVDEECRKVQQAQSQFLHKWVQEIPSPTLLSLVILEAERLGARQQQYAQKAQQMESGPESAAAGADTQAVYMQLAMDLQSGKISQEEFGDAIALQTLKVTFQYLMVDAQKKDEIMNLCLQAQKSHPLLTDDATFKSLLPSLVLSVSFALPTDAACEEYISGPLEFIRTLKTYDESDEVKDKILYRAYMYCSSMLAGTKSEQEVIHQWMEDFAGMCIEQKLSEEAMTEERGALLSRITNLCQGKADIQHILEDQVRIWSEIPDDNLSEILNTAMTIALALVQQCEKRSTLFSSLPGFQYKVSNPLSTSENANVPRFVYEEFENKFSKVLAPVFERLRSLKQRYQSATHDVIEVGGVIIPCPSPDEVLAAFDISSLLMWYPACKCIGTAYAKTDVAAHNGFYPAESLPTSLCSYLIPRAKNALAATQDPRLAQPLLALMAMLGESVHDFDLIKEATEKSLTLTEGKVTELTPPPIPEALANAYFSRADYESALHWYKLALDGVKTCVLRTKIDAIVLNACLVAAKCGQKELALKLAFTCSPQFARGVNSSKLTGPGPGRPILIQQMQFWCKDLGYQSIRDAEMKMFKTVTSV